MGDTGTGGAALAPAPGEPRVRVPVAVLVVVATVVVALLAVAAAVRLDTSSLPSGPPRDPPAPAPPATRMTVTGTHVTFRELEVDLPGSPYACQPDRPSPSRAFTQLALCGSTVHEDFDGHGNDWSAVVGVALLAPGFGAPDDLQRTTASVFDEVVGFSYGPADHPAVSRVDRAPVAVRVPAGASAAQSGRVTVQRPGLPTPYDKLVVIVVRLRDGGRVAYFSDFPHDAGRAALGAVAASVTSLRTH